MARRDVLLALIAEMPQSEHGSPPDVADVDADCPRFLLVERSRYDRSYWLTTWDTPEDAAAYHDGQEYPEDFDIDGLYDLDDGTRHDASVSTSFDIKESK